MSVLLLVSVEVFLSSVSEGRVEDFLCQLFRDQSRQFTSFRFIVQSSHEEHSDSVPIVLLVSVCEGSIVCVCVKVRECVCVTVRACDGESVCVC